MAKRLTKIVFFCILGLVSLSACSKFDDTAIWQAINNNSKEIAALKEKCNQFNSDIETLKQLVSAISEYEYITSCTPLADGTGYTLVLGSGKSIVIKNNGSGSTPTLGVSKDSDGIFYWTLNGEWLLDGTGHKIKAEGKDGSDAITPKFKIENGDWYVSTDNGNSWEKVGRATGNDGKSFFKSVQVNEGYVIIVLDDGNNTELTIPLASSGSSIAITGGYSDISGFSATISGWCKQQPSEGLSVVYGVEYSATDLTTDPTRIVAPYMDKDGLFTCVLTDLRPYTKYFYRTFVYFNNVYSFGDVKYFVTTSIPELVDLGLSVTWRKWNIGANAPEEAGDFFAWGEVAPKTEFSAQNYKWYLDGKQNVLTKYNTMPEYGPVKLQTILDPEDDAARVILGDIWRMPTYAEWEELFDNCTAEWTSINGVEGYKFTSKIAGYTSNWIFLPAAGQNYSDAIYNVGAGYYWSSTLFEEPTNAKSTYFYKDYILKNSSTMRHYGCPIRPVCGTYKQVIGFSIDKTNLSLYPGNNVQIIPNFTPSTATEQGILWSSDDPTVASVSVNGIVRGLKEGYARITARTMEGSFEASCLVTVNYFVEPEEVDMGLSVKWSSFNLGASKPEEYGSYYSWGMTELTEYAQNLYKWYDRGRYQKYCDNDNLRTLEPEDDVANVILGNGWRMPTITEWDELLNPSNCKWEWVNVNGINGYKVTSKKTGHTDSSIFLPAAGGCGYLYFSNLGESARYWASTMNLATRERNADFLFFNESGAELSNGVKYLGQPIRPVK